MVKERHSSGEFLIHLLLRPAHTVGIHPPCFINLDYCNDVIMFFVYAYMHVCTIFDLQLNHGNYGRHSIVL